MIEQILEADRMLQVDQVERARELYQRVVDLDPGNAMAVVGLAQCALADGDERQAHQLARQALEIDPENDMARRMEARLVEILATRGEAVERPAAAGTAGRQRMRPIVTEEVATPATAVDGSPQASTPAAAPASTPANRPRASDAATPGATASPAMRKSLLDRLLGR